MHTTRQKCRHMFTKRRAIMFTAPRFRIVPNWKPLKCPSKASRTDEKEVGCTHTWNIGWQLKWANLSGTCFQGLCTADVFSHYVGPGSRVTTCPERPFRGPTKQATIIHPLSQWPVLFLSQHLSRAEPTLVCSLYLCLEHRDLASLVHCRIPGTWTLSV